jgi:hypothetical protein
MQSAQATGYPQGGYPQGYPEQPANAGYDPQSAYHYPQGQPGPHQGLGGLEAAQPGAEYPGYPQPGYGHPQQGHPQQPRGYGAPGGAPGQGGYDLGGYMPAGGSGHPGEHADPLQQHPEWAHPAHPAYGDEGYQGSPLGYDQAHTGALEQAYGHEEGGEYEVEEPRRGSWLLRIAGAIVVAIGLGYGLAQGYKLMTQNAPDGATPVIKGDSEPAKTLPTDPGGKQFAHTDSKIMGRLGEGAPSSGAAAEASDSDLDASGARRVQTLVVGSDGTMTPPPAPDAPVTTGTVAVPGLTVVDGFGGRFPGSGQPPAAEAPAAEAPAAETAAAETPQATPAAASSPIVVQPPASSPVPEPEQKVANLTPPPAAAAEETSPAPPTQTVGAAATSVTGANGYVAVLASVPASGGSRLAALKKFADMQEKYGSVLQNKTPDVQEANLGERGTYHRLLVGPPGSRAQASTLCSELKSAGYKDCWVTAY